MNTVRKLLSDSEELVADFAAACDEMANSKFILSDSKISNILKIVASSSILYGLFSETLAGFDFVAEFAKCKIPNSFNRVSLRFPSEKKKCAAIVFTLLVEFDARRRDLLKFLSEFYDTEEGIQESYTLFVRSVIRTFKNNVLFLIDNEDQPEEVKVAEGFFNLSDEEDDEEDDDEFRISQNDVVELADMVREIIAQVSVESSRNVAEREEMLVITEALYNAIMTKNDKLVRITWIGVKNTFHINRLFEDKIVALGERLSDFWEI